LRLDPSERPTRARFAGILVGLVGIGLVVGVDPVGGGSEVLGTAAVVLAALLWAAAYLYMQAHLSSTTPVVVAAATVFVGALIAMPLGIAEWPSELPSATALGAACALAVLVTSWTGILLMRMIARFGTARVALADYLTPALALLFGIVILDEHLSYVAALGLLLILAGVTAASGLWRPARQLRRGITHRGRGVRYGSRRIQKSTASLSPRLRQASMPLASAMSASPERRTGRPVGRTTWTRPWATATSSGPL
jgi:threonine/homoserine efflux transporter RhtA